MVIETGYFLLLLDTIILIILNIMILGVLSYSIIEICKNRYWISNKNIFKMYILIILGCILSLFMINYLSNSIIVLIIIFSIFIFFYLKNRKKKIKKENGLEETHIEYEIKTKDKVKVLFGIIILLLIEFSKNNFPYINNDKEAVNLYINILQTEYNVTLDKTKYVVIKDSLLSKKRIKFKSNIFNNSKKEMYKYNEIYPGNNLDTIKTANDYKNITFFKEKNSLFTLKVFDYLGLRPYILNDLIYDKEKGNDFKKIEKIVKKYGEIKYKVDTSLVWECTSKEKYKEKEVFGIMSVEDNQCFIDNKYSQSEIEEYGKKFKNYFSEKRNFDTIDWYEFMKYNNIKPVITLRFENLINPSEKEKKKIIDEVSKYYNKNDITIKFLFNISNNKIIKES